MKKLVFGGICFIGGLLLFLVTIAANFGDFIGMFAIVLAVFGFILCVVGFVTKDDDKGVR
jgi:hypothetical protein